MFLVLCIVGAIAIVWLLTMVSAALSLTWSRKDPVARPRLRFLLAVMPVLVGALALGAHLSFTVNQKTFNLSGGFLCPIMLGLVGVISWFRARERRKDFPPTVDQ